MTVLEVLGAECLGAIRVGDEAESGSYVELTIDEVKSLAREGVSKSTEMVTEAHLSLTGASGKVGLYYDENKRNDIKQGRLRAYVITRPPLL